LASHLREQRQEKDNFTVKTDEGFPQKYYRALVSEQVTYLELDIDSVEKKLKAFFRGSLRSRSIGE
jgi:hypothetical protein